MARKLPKSPKGARRAGRIERTDVALATAAARHRDKPAIRAARMVVEIADQPPLIALGIATLAVGALLRKPRLLRTGIRMLASEIVATGAKSLIKQHVARTRPNKALKDGRYAHHLDESRERTEGPWSSFPSGHTAGAAAVARAITREYPAAAPYAAAGAAFVGAMQPFIGAHYPSDVAAGAVTGLASEKLVDAAMRAGASARAR